MQNNSQAKTIAAILRRLAAQIEQTPDILNDLLSDNKEISDQGETKASIQPKFDVFDLYRSQDGENVLRSRLEDCDLDELLVIVAKNGLDSTGKVRRWKKPDKVRDFIIERVEAKSNKGIVFDT